MWRRSGARCIQRTLASTRTLTTQLASCNLQHTRRPQIVVSSGESPRGCYVVEKGKFREGLADHTSGACVCEVNLLSEKLVPNSIISIEESGLLWRLDRADFEAIAIHGTEKRYDR